MSWLVDGDVLHRDSLGSRQLIQPGQLNLMTAGRGISQSEESPAERAPSLHGVQLWVALPDRERDVEPQFEHHPDLPVVADGGVSSTVLMGSLDGAASPARIYSPLVAAEVALEAGAGATLPLRTGFEYGVLALSGAADVDGVMLRPGPILYLGTGRSTLTLGAELPSRLLLLGGEPFAEELVMWWNFVGRTHDEIVQARSDWGSTGRFGTVHGYDGDPLPPPPLPTTTLKPRGRQR